MNIFKISITVILILLLVNNLKAQEDSTSNEVIRRTAQLTFVTPLGTNGLEAGKVENNISVNMIAGYSKGLKGVEFGGFSNVITGDAHGIQFAGFSNVVLGKFRGVQVAGFSNISKSGHKGAQVVGFSNVSVGDFDGIQAAGFSNIIRGEQKGIQAAGFSNVTVGKVNGVQASTFSNVAKNGVKGTQISTFSNVSSGKTEAIQVSTFSNVASDTLQGVQVSAFLNIAKVVKGVQVSFINISDTIAKGVPIGFLSIVKKGGYHKFEIGGGETFHLNTSYKTGVSRFYNIFSLGLSYAEEDFHLGFGYGIGTEMSLKNNFNLNFELIGYSVMGNLSKANYIYDYYFDSLTKLHITVSKQFAKYLTVYAGPTLNFCASDRTDTEGNYLGSVVVPWSAYSKTNYYAKTDFYPGFRLGLRF